MEMRVKICVHVAALSRTMPEIANLLHGDPRLVSPQSSGTIQVDMRMTRLRPTLAFSTVILLALGACSKPAGEEGSSSSTEAATTETAPDPVAAPVDYASLKGDAAAGEAAFAQCKACHSLEEGKAMIGPSLHKVIGRAAGSVAGFSYSTAMKSSGITWTEEKIFGYLEKPQGVVPGTKMSFAGYPDPQKRADLIAWLKANGGS
jgi:cytochrome c